MRAFAYFRTWLLVLALGHPAFAPLGLGADPACDEVSIFSPESRKAIDEELSGAFVAFPRSVLIRTGNEVSDSFSEKAKGQDDDIKLSCQMLIEARKKSLTADQWVDTRLLYVTDVDVGPHVIPTIDLKITDDPLVSRIACKLSGARSAGEAIRFLNEKLRIVHLPEQKRPCTPPAPVDGSGQAAAAAPKKAPQDKTQAVKAIFDAHCANCHKDGDGDQGGFGSLKNKEELIARRLVVPGDAKGSTLYQEIENGRMPQGGTALSAGQKVAIEEWIRDLPAAKPPKTLIKNEEVVQAVLDDLKKHAPLDQPFIRYFRLDGLINAGVPAAKVAEYKEALSKLINGLSWKRDVYLPEEADPQGRFLRIDLRKLGWKASSWEKIQAADPFKFSTGDAAIDATRKELSKLSASSDPIVRTDWFLANGSKPPLYHDVLEMPATLGGLEKLLGIDTQRAFRESDLARSGFANSGVSQSNRIIERYETPYGAYWKSLDYSGNEGRQNIFANPLDSSPAGGEVIFNLPNGSQAYVLADAQGKRINKAPVNIVSDPSRPDRTVENGISCFGCHATTIIPKDDEIRELAEKAFANKAFSEKDMEIIRKLHVKPEELRAMVERDSKRYQATLGRISERSAREDTLSPLIRSFEAPVSLGTAASELGVEPATLIAAIEGAFGQVTELGPLVSGKCEIPRNIYEASFSQMDALLRTGNAGPVLKAEPYVGALGLCGAVREVRPFLKNGRLVSFRITFLKGSFSPKFNCNPKGLCSFQNEPGQNFDPMTAQIQNDRSIKVTDFTSNPGDRCSGTLRPASR